MGDAQLSKKYGISQKIIDKHYKAFSSSLLQYIDDDEEATPIKPSLLYWSDDYDSTNTRESVTLVATEINTKGNLLEEFRLLTETISLPYIKDKYNIFASGTMFQGTPDMLNKEQQKVWRQYINMTQQVRTFFKNDEELFDNIHREINPTDAVIIDKDCRIILPNYGNKEILPNKPLSRAFYILYLRHPEGILSQYLDDHKSEFKAIYRQVTGNRELDHKELRSLEEFSKNLVVRRNEIKTAFLQVIGRPSLSNYIIDGSYGEPKR